MTVILHPKLKQTEPESKTVNVFDLTATDKGTSTPESSTELSTSEKAVRIALIVILGMIVVTAMSLLVAEAIGLRWCCRKLSKEQQNLETLEKSWFHWPRLFQPDRTSNSYLYENYWKSLPLAEKRQEMFRTTYGEVDLYDMYEELSHKKHQQNNH